MTMTTSAGTGVSAPAGHLPQGCIAPPCAQPLDGLHKTLYGGFLILAAALLVAINQIPPARDLPAPASCAAHIER